MPIVSVMQLAEMWGLLRKAILHYMRAQTAEQFTLIKRREARDALIKYGAIIQEQVVTQVAFV